ncbi:MAG: gamma-glutamyltransferase [Xanthobacteraceae bacterium]
MTRDFHRPGRSPVLAGEAMAATSHPLATAAAIDALKAGGTAADAAVTAVATLCVVEPAMTGVGGDCFCQIARPSHEVWGYNGSGRSGSGASTEKLLAQGMRSIDMMSIHAVTVPGAVEAWEQILKAHGRFGLDRALAPAIHYAENGFPVAPRVAYDWSHWVKKLAANPGATRHYLFNGAAPKVGDVIKFPALAATLRTIAAGGARAYYEGAIAEDIVDTIGKLGSFVTLEDFANHRGDMVRPISTNYRGLDVTEIPPNGQGLTALVMLNILERFEMAKFDPVGPERLHLMLEAARMAFAVRDTHVADPQFMRIDVGALLDKKFAGSLSARIDPARRVAVPPTPTPGNDTVYLTIVDRDRMAVSFINSLFSAFGTGICTEKTGIMLSNRGSGFVLDAKHPNTLGPRKRPMHTIIPALAMREGRCEMAFGVMGAHYQPMGHTQIVTNVVDHGMDIQTAIDAPRFFFTGEQTLVERGISEATIEGLRARGHDVAVAPLPWGGSQAIQIDWKSGVLTGGSDPRKDGCALGY